MVRSITQRTGTMALCGKASGYTRKTRKGFVDILRPDVSVTRIPTSKQPKNWYVGRESA